MTGSATAVRLNEPPLVRQTAAFGMPLVIAMALGALFNLVDLYIVAQYENAAQGINAEVAVAACTVGSLVNSIPQIIFNGIVNAMIALVARYHGLGSRRKANVAAGQGLTLTVILSILMGVPPWFYAEEICAAMGAAGPALAPAIDYLAVMSLGTFTMFLLLHVTGVLRAVGNSTVPLVLLGGANLLNILLDIWFIWGGFGVPELGVGGAAWATVVARGIFAAVGLGLLWRGFLGMKLRTWMWRGRIMWELLKIGVPSCMQWLVRMLAYLYILGFVADAAPRAGVDPTDAQAAFGVGLRLDSLVLFSSFGWAAAAATLVGQNLGRGRPQRAERATWIALGLNMLMMLVFASAYVLFADQLLELMFLHSEGEGTAAVMEIGRTYLFVASASYAFVGVGIVISQALAGAGATKFPLLIELIAYVAIGYPLTGYVAENAETYGLRGLWLTAVALHIGVAVAYVLWFRLGWWKRKEIR